MSDRKHGIGLRWFLISANSTPDKLRVVFPERDFAFLYQVDQFVIYKLAESPVLLDEDDLFKGNLIDHERIDKVFEYIHRVLNGFVRTLAKDRDDRIML